MYIKLENMKIDRTKIKRTSNEIVSNSCTKINKLANIQPTINKYNNQQTPECKQVINDILKCSDDELVEELRKLKSWSYGKVWLRDFFLIM